MPLRSREAPAAHPDASVLVPYSGITCIVAVPGTVVIPGAEAGAAAGAGAGFAA
ncbi:hypothetical protein [Methyloceanibacter sp.]|uniref:hypothetical protein n=1 Tax=Methyloceanibacter sp. TaxID=1965321 RepID=UPI003D6CE1D4